MIRRRSCCARPEMQTQEIRTETQNGPEITVAFVGNPNCGKTTLFNALTGATLKVANWPGVTVERVEGEAKYKDQRIRVIDLPGIYSLTSYSIEEKVSRKCVMDEKVDVIINVVDASSLERNLYLTLQLLELGKAGHGDRSAPASGNAGKYSGDSGVRQKTDRSGGSAPCSCPSQ